MLYVEKNVNISHGEALSKIQQHDYTEVLQCVNGIQESIFSVSVHVSD
jgi:hypothetical protein